MAHNNSYKVQNYAFWHVRQTKTQISLRIRAFWPKSSLSAWRNSACLTIQNVHSENSDRAHIKRYAFVSTLRLNYFQMDRHAAEHILQMHNIDASLPAITLIFIRPKVGVVMCIPPFHPTKTFSFSLYPAKKNSLNNCLILYISMNFINYTNRMVNRNQNTCLHMRTEKYPNRLTLMSHLLRDIIVNCSSLGAKTHTITLQIRIHVRGQGSIY